MNMQSQRQQFEVWMQLIFLKRIQRKQKEKKEDALLQQFVLYSANTIFGPLAEVCSRDIRFCLGMVSVGQGKSGILIVPALPWRVVRTIGLS